MAAFKQFTTKEVTITPFTPHKSFTFTGNAITSSDNGIDIYTGLDVPYTSSQNLSYGFSVTRSLNSVFNSTKQLYYSNYFTSSKGDNVPLPVLIPGVTKLDDRNVGPSDGPRFDNFLQTDLTQSRFFPTQTTESDNYIGVVSIPTRLYGDNILPNTFVLEYTGSGGTIPNTTTFLITDDGEGNLIGRETFETSVGTTLYSSSTYDSTYVYGGTVGTGFVTTEGIVGQIFYSQGIAVLTSGSSSLLTKDINVAGGPALNDCSISFSSSFRVEEHQYRCTINENEFLSSQNPTLLSGSENYLYKDFATGSDFSPYMTAVGLYSENNELLAVGKFSIPIPISKTTDTTVVVNFDI